MENDQNGSQQTPEDKGRQAVIAFQEADNVIAGLTSFAKALGASLRFEMSVMEQGDEPITLVKAYYGESKDHFALGAAKGEGGYNEAAVDLVKKLISKIVMDIPQGAVGFVVTSASGPSIKFDERRVNVTVHAQSRNSMTATIVQP